MRGDLVSRKSASMIEKLCHLRRREISSACLLVGNLVLSIKERFHENDD